MEFKLKCLRDDALYEKTAHTYQIEACKLIFSQKLSIRTVFTAINPVTHFVKIKLVLFTFLRILLLAKISEAEIETNIQINNETKLIHVFQKNIASWILIND